MQALIPSSNLFISVRKYIAAHKIMSGIIAAVVVFGGYWTYGKFHTTPVETRYVLGNVATGTVISVISGSGQVSASNQVDIKPKASGEITALNVREGQYVAQGAAIAYIDSGSAQKAVRDAQTNLESAQLALEKLQQPGDAVTLTQAQNSLAQAQQSKLDAADSLTKSYDDAFNEISSTYIALPTVMTGLNTVLFGYDNSLGGASQWNIDFYSNAINQYDGTLRGTQYSDDAKAKYSAAKTAYDKAFAGYKTISRASDTAAIENLLQETYAMTKTLSEAVKSANNLVQLYQDVITAHGLTPRSASNTQLTTLNTYTSTTNTYVSGLAASITSIKTAKQDGDTAVRNIAASQASLDKAQAGTDPLDLRSSQITVQQRQNALTDAQNTLADYAIRAPFSGTLAKLSIQKGDNVSSGTSAATLITTQEIAELSLNEIDATKIKIGQKATLTFDAIDGLSVTGKVASIDSLGTVTQGVVSYTVKIGFDTQDARVKPGMTVNADIQAGIAQNVLTVPASAVKTSNDANYVQVFSPALTVTGGTTGTVSAIAPTNVPVTIGISDDTMTEIVSGLSAGQQIVIRTMSGSASAAAPATGANTRGGLGGIPL